MKAINTAGKCLQGLRSKFCVVAGSQWGDEGKGKLVDILSEKYDYCARFNGGANAGHTVVVNKKKYAFHLLPCGILYNSCKNIVGNGVVVHFPTIFEELAQLDRDKVNYSGRLLISDRAHIVTNFQLEADKKGETDSKRQFLGTTKRGIGPTYASKASRISLRVGDLQNWDSFKEKQQRLANRYRETDHLQVDTDKELKEFKEIRDRVLEQKMVVDTVSLIHKEMAAGKRFLAEGANACMLDIDFGTYPYVTSSSTTVGGVCTGLGVSPQKIETVIGIVKAYTTRVGEGPFPTELKDQIGESLRKIGSEFGATTGRPRRCGWLDIPVLRYSTNINGYSSINITKLDVLSDLDEIKIGVNYKINGKVIDYMPANIEELSHVQIEYKTVKGWKKNISMINKFENLPKEAQDYIYEIENLLGVPVSWIGTGPEREAIIRKNNE